MALFGRKKERISKERDERRTELAEAAEQLFQQKGFAGTSVDDIVASVGVSKGTFFYHFPTKEDVLMALGEKRVKSLRESMRKWLHDESMEPEEKLSRFFEELANFRRARRAVDWIGFGLIREDPVIHNTLVNYALRPIVDDLTAILEQGQKLGRFRMRSPRGTALCLVMLCADIIHRTATTESIVKWSELRHTVWEIIAHSVGLSEDE